ncbi:MAG: hypothetical protein ABI838_02250, partial [Chloroflexota bacterium]
APGTVFPAHGRSLTNGAEVVAGLVAHHGRRKDRIVALVGDREVSAWQVALELWGHREHIWERRMALQEGLAHLQSLAVAGRLEKLATPERVSWRRPR